MYSYLSLKRKSDIQSFKFIYRTNNRIKDEFVSRLRYNRRYKIYNTDVYSSGVMRYGNKELIKKLKLNNALLGAIDYNNMDIIRKCIKKGLMDANQFVIYLKIVLSGNIRLIKYFKIYENPQNSAFFLGNFILVKYILDEKLIVLNALKAIIYRNMHETIIHKENSIDYKQIKYILLKNNKPIHFNTNLSKYINNNLHIEKYLNLN